MLDEAVRRAEAPNVRGLVVFAHADPRFGRGAPPLDGFARYRAALQAHAERLAKPMLLVHGDGHRYRVDQPLRDRATGRRLATFTRVEVFGAPELNWVRVDVDPAHPRLFAISPGTTVPGSQLEPPPAAPLIYINGTGDPVPETSPERAGARARAGGQWRRAGCALGAGC